jgi:hypothetical protein
VLLQVPMVSTLLEFTNASNTGYPFEANVLLCDLLCRDNSRFCVINAYLGAASVPSGTLAGSILQ